MIEKEDIANQQLTLTGIEFICFYNTIHIIYLLKARFVYIHRIINYNTSSSGFVSWIVNFFKNCFVFVMVTLCWISSMGMIEYHMNLLLLFKHSQILIQSDCYQPKHVALPLIKSLLIIVIVVLILKTNEDDFQYDLLFEMYILHVIICEILNYIQVLMSIVVLSLQLN